MIDNDIHQLALRIFLPCLLSILYSSPDLKKGEKAPEPTLDDPRSPNDDERKQSVKFLIYSMAVIEVSHTGMRLFGYSCCSLLLFPLALSLPSSESSFSRLFNENCSRAVVGSGSIIIFHLGKL